MNKRSKTGALLSVIVVVLSVVYFAYLLILYLGNQIDPKYKMQTFLTENIQVEYHNDVMGFRYEYNINQPLEDLEQKTGKKYLVYQAFLYLTSPTDIQTIPLDVIKCQNESLIGFNCLDLSKVSNYTLEVNTKENIQKNIVILVYRCQDTDMYKETIPDNCAPEKEIDSMINYQDSQFKIKMYTAQYNTMNEEFESNYKNFYLYIQGDDFVFTRFKTVKQITTVKKGPFIQGSTSFQSPIDYLREDRIFNREKIIKNSGLTFNLQITLDVAEQFQYVQIQYPSFMEILTVCNSTFALLMGIGVIGRYIAQKLIKQDIQLILLKNLYQKQYFKSLQKHNIFSYKETKKEVFKEKQYEDIVENTESICIPSFLTKSRDAVELAQTNNIQFTQDYVLQNIKGEQKQLNFKENDETLQTDEYNNEKNKNQTSDMIMTKTIDQKDKQVNDLQQSNISEKFTKHKLSDQKIQKFRILESGNLLLQENNKDSIDNPSSRFNSRLQKYEKRQRSFTNVTSPKYSQSSARTEKSQNFIKGETFQQIDKNQYFEKAKIISDQVFGFKFQKIFFDIRQIFNFNNNNQLFFSLFSFCQSIRQLLNNDEDIKIKSTLEMQTNKHLDILSLFRDIIVLKKAIMMILSKDQFAAIQLIGCDEMNYSPETLNENNSNKIQSGKKIIYKIILNLKIHFKQKTKNQSRNQDIQMSNSQQNNQHKSRQLTFKSSQKDVRIIQIQVNRQKNIFIFSMNKCKNYYLTKHNLQQLL